MRSLALSLSLAAAVLVAIAAPRAHAQTAEDGWAPPETASRSTSGEPSLLSGRTLGNGEVMLGAALGWPGLWAQVELAPDASLNLGIRVAVLYGSAVMGLIEGAGGEMTIPIRIHVHGDVTNGIDLSLRIAPQIAVGEGRLFGEQASPRLSSDLGISSRLEVGLLLGLRVVERLTLIFGASAAPGLSWVDPDPIHPIGVFTGAIGIEALMSLDTMLFGLVEAGAGIAEGRAGVPLYPAQEIFRLSLGLAYAL